MTNGPKISVIMALVFTICINVIVDVHFTIKLLFQQINFLAVFSAKIFLNRYIVVSIDIITYFIFDINKLYFFVIPSLYNYTCTN